jgi:hypothetical protein
MKIIKNLIFFLGLVNLGHHQVTLDVHPYPYRIGVTKGTDSGWKMTMKKVSKCPKYSQITFLSPLKYKKHKKRGKMPLICFFGMLLMITMPL